MRVKKLFAEQIQRIDWKFKLAPTTVNVTATDEVPEIQVFHIQLRTRKLDEDVLRCIDTAINFPIFYELRFKGEVMEVGAYKRKSDSDPTKWVTGEYFWSDWLPVDVEREPLPVSLNMTALYSRLLSRLLPYALKDTEEVGQCIDRITTIRGLEKTCGRLSTRIRREKQFNRQVDLNKELRQIQQQIKQLTE